MSDIPIYANDTGLDVYIQFDNDQESPIRVQAIEGEDSFLRRYIITIQDLIDAGLPSGTYHPSVRLGDAEYPEDDDPIEDSFDFIWDGEQEITLSNLQDIIINGVIDQLEYITLDVETHAAGGGVLQAKIGDSSLSPTKFLEVVQGESKLITFIVQVVGRFDEASCENIIVKFADAEGTKFTKDESIDDGVIFRVTEELDLQVIRVLLIPEETAELVAGLLTIELAFDDQKARLTHSLNILEQIVEEES